LLAPISFQSESSTYGIGYSNDIVNASNNSCFCNKLILTNLLFVLLGKLQYFIVILFQYVCDRVFLYACGNFNCFIRVLFYCAMYITCQWPCSLRPKLQYILIFHYLSLCCEQLHTAVIYNNHRSRASHGKLNYTATRLN